MTLSIHWTVAQLERAKAAFRESWEAQGSWVVEEQVAKRQRAIEALPVKVWKGSRVYQLQCHGDFGNGPHEMWVPEGLLWTLINFANFRCPYHG